MRYLILSDIHANAAALDAVIADAEGSYDEILNCGDIVGYGPDPNYVTEFCRTRCRHVVRGNHDKAAVGLIDLEWFNAVAKVSATWTGVVLTRDNSDWIAGLQAGPLELDSFSLMHGSPSDEDEYIIMASDAREASDQAPNGISFFGHTHVQGGFNVHRNGVRSIESETVQLDDTSSWLINPGSVGQPRDGDPRAAWAIYDTAERTVTFRRTAYEISLTHERIIEAGLPEVLGLRLYRGL